MSCLNLVIEEVNPQVIITSAKQEHCVSQFIKNLGKSSLIPVLFAQAVISGHREQGIHRYSFHY